MKLIDTVYKCIHEYPNLFYFKDHPTLSDFEISRLAVLERLFLTNGNGCCWVDGYLCNSEEAVEADFDGKLGWIAEGPAYGELKYRKRFWPPKRKERFEQYAHEYTFVKERSPKYPFTIYPVSSYFAFMPDFVRPDWLEGARDILQFAIQCFEDEEYRGWKNSKIPAKERKRYLKILFERLAKVKTRLSDTGKKESPGC